jgi:hypothetical protein
MFSLSKYFVRLEIVLSCVKRAEEIIYAQEAGRREAKDLSDIKQGEMEERRRENTTSEA